MCGLRKKSKRSDFFRHTFAVKCLKKWVLDGVDLNAALPVLSKYLGHVGLNETQHYLRLTSELYPDIIKKLTVQFGNFIPDYFGGDEYEAY
jgi:integrase/recombinase XerD